MFLCLQWSFLLSVRYASRICWMWFEPTPSSLFLFLDNKIHNFQFSKHTTFGHKTRKEKILMKKALSRYLKVLIKKKKLWSQCIKMESCSRGIRFKVNSWSVKVPDHKGYWQSSIRQAYRIMQWTYLWPRYQLEVCLTFLLTIWTISSSWREWPRPQCCGWCLALVPHTSTYFTSLIKFLCMWLQKSSTMHPPLSCHSQWELN
jgi:hypothetical protein